MTEQAVQVLYAITVALKGPVVLGVLAVLAWSVFEVGRFLREWVRRGSRRRAWDDGLTGFVNAMIARKQGLAELFGGTLLPELVAANLSIRGGGNPVHDLQELTRNMEMTAGRWLAVLRIGLRIGPVLGLMGTLIPMGPALMSISRGDLTVMSNDLIIAFSTTVAGLTAGTLFYVMLIVRQNWYARDVGDVEALIDRVETGFDSQSSRGGLA